MTNEELKKKIVDIIRYCYVNEKDYGYIFDVHIEEKINAMADALIAAGIVDKSDYASMKETAVRYKAEVSKAGARAKEAEHRAQVAENELKLYKLAVKIWQERYSDIRCFNFNIALRQAEKELAEEGKDD